MNFTQNLLKFVLIDKLLFKYWCCFISILINGRRGGKANKKKSKCKRRSRRKRRRAGGGAEGNKREIRRGINGRRGAGIGGEKEEGEKAKEEELEEMGSRKRKMWKRAE